MDVQGPGGRCTTGGSPVDVSDEGFVFALCGQQWPCFAADDFDDGRRDRFRTSVRRAQVTDVSDADVGIRVDGPDAQAVLATDWEPEAFSQTAVVGTSARL